MFVGLKYLEEVKLPNLAIGFDPAEALKTLKNGPSALYDDINRKWINWPSNSELREQGKGERLVAEIFNKMGSAVADYRGTDGTTQKWGEALCDYPILQNRQKIQPHITVMVAEHGDSEDAVDLSKGWEDIFALVGVGGRKRGDIMDQLTHSARLMFAVQPDRNFVLAVAVLNEKMSLHVFNRAGRTSSDYFNVHKNPERFLRVAAGLMFADRQYLGFDATIMYTPFDNVDGFKRYIEVDGDRYDIVEVLHTEHVMRGRGTVCFKVKKGESIYVVKNAWIDKKKLMQEQKILEQLHQDNIPNITKIEKYQLSAVTTRSDVKACVARRQNPNERAEKALEGKVERVQVRSVLGLYGKSILDFSSLSELLHAFINIVEALEAMHEKNYLHRDISVYNILLNEDKRTNGERDGLLIDFDHAINLLTHLFKAMSERAGTLPFMAIELLSATDTINHKYYHDLESLFYVLCYICCVCSGPNGRARANFDIDQSALKVWFGAGAKNTETVGKLKACIVLLEFEDVLETFDSYFAPLKNYVRMLHRIATPPLADVLEEARLSGKKPEELELKQIRMEQREPAKYFKAYKEVLQKAYHDISQQENVQRCSSANGSNEIATPSAKMSTILQGKEDPPSRPRDIMPEAFMDNVEGLDGIAEELGDDNKGKGEEDSDELLTAQSLIDVCGSNSRADNIENGRLKRKATLMEEPSGSLAPTDRNNSQCNQSEVPTLLCKFSSSCSNQSRGADSDHDFMGQSDATEQGSLPLTTKKRKTM